MNILRWIECGVFAMWVFMRIMLKKEKKMSSSGKQLALPVLCERESRKQMAQEKEESSKGGSSRNTFFLERLCPIYTFYCSSFPHHIAKGTNPLRAKCNKSHQEERYTLLSPLPCRSLSIMCNLFFSLPSLFFCSMHACTDAFCFQPQREREKGGRNIN